MLLKEEKWDSCRACNRRTKIIQEESYGCDECKRPIDAQLNSGNIEHADYLRVTVHHHAKEAEYLHFCSWTCVLKYVPKIRTDYFIVLPFITFDGRWPGTTAKDFFKALKRLGRT